jgi:hypothetical protein
MTRIYGSRAAISGIQLQQVTKTLDSGHGHADLESRRLQE